MATEWKKLSLRLRPEVHYTLMQLCPNPTKAIRHLINLYTKSLVQAKFKDNVPTEFNLDLKELEQDDRD